MKGVYLLAVSLFVLVLGAFSQEKLSVKGELVDTSAVSKIADASVIVLNAKDSILVDFSRTSADGSFSFIHLPVGKFLLLVIYPDYADYVDAFELRAAGPALNLGKIAIVRKSILLNEVLIKGRPDAIKIKGDTTEFNARAFVIQPNARVEDLLKQFPGIQVDKDGRITAQGQIVTKVLVDGEEFFGDDPTLVTKNIRADMVDKVQLYDKKSDQASFTGIDDGVKTKTLNVKLKEDKKNGYFGKVDAGIGTSGYYQGQLLYNRFSGKQKLSMYGTVANTGKVGLNWQDGQKYGTANNLQSGDGGLIVIGGGGDELETFNGRYNGQGLPTARTGGVHYDDKWNSDKVSTNDNYKFASLDVDGVKERIVQNNVPGHLIRTTDNQAYHNHVFRQKADATFDIKTDSTSSLKIFVSGIAKNTKSINSYLGSSVDSASALLNHSTRSLTNNSDQRAFDASILYAKRFKKKGRTFSLTIGESNNKNNSNGFLNSGVDFYSSHATVDSIQRISQYKTNVTSDNLVTANAVYSEPLTKTISLIVNYGYAYDGGSSNRSSFSEASPGLYSLFVDSLSSAFILNRSSQQGGVFTSYAKGKTTINIGTRLYGVGFKQLDKRHTDELRRTFVNWTPQMSYQRRISQLASFRAEYNGTASLPTIEQIQPVKTNVDPLNIVVGNPDLRPSYSNRFSVNYNSYNIPHQQAVYLSGSYNMVSNAIVNSVLTNYQTGKSVYTTINLQGKTPVNYNVSVNLSRKIKPLDASASINAYLYGNTLYGISNGALNKSISNSYTIQAGISKSREKKYDLYVNAGPGYTISQSSLQRENNNAGTFNADGGMTLYLPLKIQFGSDGKYEYAAPSSSFNQPYHLLILNASVSKKFFKREDLRVTLLGNDLLNRNTGFSRNTYANTMEQTTETTIKRYFKVSVTWDFNHVIGNAKKQ